MKSRREFIKNAGVVGLGLTTIADKVSTELSGQDYTENHIYKSFQKSNPRNSNIFKASVVKSDITPSNSQKLMGYMPRMSTGIRDKIYHKVIVMDDGQNKFILVSSDLVRVAPSTYDDVARRIFKKTGVKENNFWWTFTHTHSAPEVGSSGIIPFFFEHTDRYAQKEYDEEYYEFVLESLVNATVEAINILKPAQLGIGWGFSKANINRRAKDIDNKPITGENPDGTVDRKIGLISIVDYDQKPIALISNYAIHGTVLPSDDTRISGDVPGVVAEYIEDKIGAPLLFINGAEGNIAPRYSVVLGKRDIQSADRFLDQFKNLLGEKILIGNSSITNYTRDVHFRTDRIFIETPMKEILIGRWPEDMKHYTRHSSTGQNLIRFPVSFMFLNHDIAIWGAPCELFCEISNYIRANSGFPNTFYFGLTNGSVAYFPTKNEMRLGGYEARTSPFTEKAEKDLIDDVQIRLTEELVRITRKTYDY